MSIREQYKIAVNAGWLVNLLPTLPSIPHRRVIFVCRALHEEIEREWNEPATAIRVGQLLNTLDTFLGNGLITVGRRNDKHAYMKQMEKVEEVWEIRSVDPKPSIRVFGRFAERDVFVATNKGFRKPLGAFGSPEFKRAMTTCTQEWRRCFQTWPVHTGDTVHDYLSENVVDLRDL